MIVLTLSHYGSLAVYTSYNVIKLQVHQIRFLRSFTDQLVFDRPQGYAVVKNLSELEIADNQWNRDIDLTSDQTEQSPPEDSIDYHRARLSRTSIKFIAANKSFKEQLGLLEFDDNRIVTTVMGLPTAPVEPTGNQSIGRQTFGAFFKEFAVNAEMDPQEE